MNLLQWLKVTPEFPKFYLRSREGTVERAFCGVASYGEKTVGGMAFFPNSSSKDSLWNSFPSSAFWTPKWEKQADISLENPQKLSLPTGNSTSLPTAEEWEQLVKQCLCEMQKGSLEKVVLARRTTLQIQVDPYELLQHLRFQSAGAALFSIQFSPDSTFIGVTPERLYQRKGKQIRVDALAGTSPLGKEGLIDNPKEKREFAFVKYSIESAAAPLCEKWQWEGEDRIHKTSSLQHLYNCFIGTLQSDITDADLLKALHPTAALGGMPRQKALDYIAKHEPFERGWYAAPLGFSSLEEAEYLIGIRSALLTEQAIHLFAGAGIVMGSNPSQEWEELNHKISLIKNLLV